MSKLDNVQVEIFFCVWGNLDNLDKLSKLDIVQVRYYPSLKFCEGRGVNSDN